MNKNQGPSLCLLVLKSDQTDAMLAFYGAIGLSFTQEQHGSGPVHYSAQTGSTVFELYPLGSKDVADNSTRLGFAVENLEKTLTDLKALNCLASKEPESTTWGRRAVVRDPDDRHIELYEQKKREL